MTDANPMEFLQNHDEEPAAPSEPKVILVSCPECGQEYKLSGDKAGKRVKCRECETRILVPGGVAKPKIKSVPQLSSPTKKEQQPTAFQKLGSVIGGVIGIYWLCTNVIGCVSSDYPEADRLTREIIQTMDEAATLAEGLDPTQDMPSAVEKQMNDYTQQMETKTKRLLTLELSNKDRSKLKQKHQADLDQAKHRFDQAMTKLLKQALSNLKR